MVRAAAQEREGAAMGALEVDDLADIGAMVGRDDAAALELHAGPAVEMRREQAREPGRIEAPVRVGIVDPQPPPRLTSLRSRPCSSAQWRASASSAAQSAACPAASRLFETVWK